MRIEPLDGSGEAEADGLTKRDRLILAHPPAQNLTYGVEDSGAHPELRCVSTGPSSWERAA